MKIETKTMLTFKDGTTVAVDEAELRQLLESLKARFEAPPLDQPNWLQILKEKERGEREERQRAMWKRQPYQVTCQGTPQ